MSAARHGRAAVVRRLLQRLRTPGLGVAGTGILEEVNRSTVSRTVQGSVHGAYSR